MNTLQLIGRLGHNPRTFGNVTKFNIATKNGKNTLWVPLTTFGKLAESCAKHLVKGRRVGVQASVRQNSFERDGIQVFETQVIAHKVEFLGQPSLGPVPSFDDTSFNDDDIPF